MRFSMRFALLAGLLSLSACGGDGHGDDHHGGGGKGGSGGKSADAGVVDSGTDPGGSQSALDRPGTLARPPKGGLPAELRPPR